MRHRQVTPWWIIVAVVAWAAVMVAWYLSAKDDCDRRGGTLVRGAFLPFACVTQPHRTP